MSQATLTPETDIDADSDMGTSIEEVSVCLLTNS